MIVERVRERIDLCDPVAAHRMPTVAQRAVDQLDVVLSAGQNDQRHRRLRLGHALSESLWKAGSLTPGLTVEGTRVTNAVERASADQGFA